MKGKLDVEGFGQSLAMIVQIWTIFKEIVIESKVGLEFVVWVLGNGKEKFEMLLRELVKEYKKTLLPPTTEEYKKSPPPTTIEAKHVIIDFDFLDLYCPPGLMIAYNHNQVESRVRGTHCLSGINVRLHFAAEQDGNGLISGYDLKKRLAGQKVLGPQLIDFYLQHMDLIPEELRVEGLTYYFWGVVYEDSLGHFFVRYFRWDKGARLVHGYQSLASYWYSNDPAVVAA